MVVDEELPGPNVVAIACPLRAISRREHVERDVELPRFTIDITPNQLGPYMTMKDGVNYSIGLHSIVNRHTIEDHEKSRDRQNVMTCETNHNQQYSNIYK